MSEFLRYRNMKYVKCIKLVPKIHKSEQNIKINKDRSNSTLKMNSNIFKNIPDISKAEGLALSVFIPAEFARPNAGVSSRPRDWVPEYSNYINLDYFSFFFLNLLHFFIYDKTSKMKVIS